VTADEGFIRANGIRLHYHTWYPPSEGHVGFPAVVLVHATGFLARLWEPVAERLAVRYHVFAYDTRGHGDSEKLPPDADNYHWRHCVADLRAFMDNFALRDVPIVGHSAGGAAAAYLAATAPGYASRLVLIEPIIFPAPTVADAEGNHLAVGARRRRMIWSSPEEVVESYRKRETFARWREDILRLYAEHGTFRREDGQYELKCPGEIEALAFENSTSLNTWDLLPDIKCPVLVMRGELTDPLVGRVSQSVADRVPAGRLLTVKGAGHLLPMETPETVAGEVMSFLEESA
jgi:lipase